MWSFLQEEKAGRRLENLTLEPAASSNQLSSLPRGQTPNSQSQRSTELFSFNMSHLDSWVAKKAHPCRSPSVSELGRGLMTFTQFCVDWKCLQTRPFPVKWECVCNSSTKPQSTCRVTQEPFGVNFSPLLFSCFVCCAFSWKSDLIYCCKDPIFKLWLLKIKAREWKVSSRHSKLVIFFFQFFIWYLGLGHWHHETHKSGKGPWRSSLRPHPFSVPFGNTLTAGLLGCWNVAQDRVFPQPPQNNSPNFRQFWW